MKIIEKLGISNSPWEIKEISTFRYDKFNGKRRYVSSNGKGVCGSTKKENANLIAAAPEMLEALIDMLMEFQDYWGIEDEDMCTEINPILKSLQAIQKATGKSWEEIKALL
jgi:hypothetical protein